MSHLINKLYNLWVALKGEGFADSAAMVVDIERQVAELEAQIKELETPNMFWDCEDDENGIESIDDYLIDNDLSGRIYAFSQAHRLATVYARVEFLTGDHEHEEEPIVKDATKEEYDEQRERERQNEEDRRRVSARYRKDGPL